MIGFIECKDKLGKIGDKCSNDDYNFAFQVACGIKPDDAYISCILGNKTSKMEVYELVTEKELHAQEAKRYAKKPQILKLINMFKADIDREMQKQILLQQKNNLSTKEEDLSISDIRKFLSQAIKTMSPQDSDIVKDILPVINVYLSKLVDNDKEDIKQYYAIEKHDEYNCLCPKCNRECHGEAGINLICPNCGFVIVDCKINNY